MKGFLSLMFCLERLKQTARTGWNMEFPPDSRFKTRRVKDAESVADHSWCVAMFALAVAHELGLDGFKMAWMALVHDVAELVTLDIVTATLDPMQRQNAEAEKRMLEDAAMREIFLPYGEWGSRSYELWLEFEARATPEARALKQIDKLETCIQALFYRELGHDVNPVEFFDEAEAFMKDPEFVNMLARLRERADSGERRL